MSEVIEFVRARLHDRKRVALAVPERRRSWSEEGGSVIAGHLTDDVVDWVYDEGAAEHIALNDPASVLRDVEADRRIVELHTNDHGACRVCWRVTARSSVREDYPCATVRLLALRFDQHPDYQQEWRV